MGEGQNTNPITPPAGTDPSKTVNPGNQGDTFDTSKISDTDFAKIFDDPRTFKHDRFKELAQAKQERDQLKEANKVAEEKKLTEQKEFEKLAKLRETEANTWKQKAQDSTVNAEITTAALQLGAVDLKAVVKLIDKGSIKVAEDGTITGLSEALDKLKTESPYLFDANNKKTLGTGTNPGQGNTGIKRFKRSQLSDAKFFRDNQKEIMEAYKNGQIEDDLR